jgi:type IV secretory pathway VirB2 component (pilin)
MSNLPRISVMIVGAVGTIAGLLGLCYNGMTLTVAFRGGFSDLVKQHGLSVFYPAFYTMSGICVGCYLLVLACGIALLRGRLRWARFLTGVLLFEVIYFLSVSLLWTRLTSGMSVAAATGVANGGLMVQFVILFPLWGPLVLWWAKKRLDQGEQTGN